MAGGSTAVLPVPGGRRPEQDVSLPTQVYFEVTNRCNLACTTCVRTFTEVEPPADLSYEGLVGIAEQLPRIERAVLHGIGEPLLVKDLPKMVAYLKSRGAHVLFNTNATALTRRWGERLIEAGLDECRISLDAASHETFLAIRGTHDFERVLANAAGMARLLRERGAARPRLSIWATAMRENVAELPALVRICSELDIPMLYLQRLVHFDTGLATREQSLRHDIAEAERAALAECERVAAELGVELRGSGASSGTAAVSERSHADRPWSACYRPWKVAYVTANGNAMPCCFAPFVTQDFPGLVLGNVLDEGFAAVWNGARYQEFRRRHQSDDPPPPCKPCGSEWSL
jgi:MoaA/NifB/PqqE/SkfB family radical SAM enzyme